MRYPHNLTPDPGTGIGNWSEDDIVKAIRQAHRPDQTPIRGAMPWFHFVYFSEADARAIAAYLKSIPPIQHKVPDRVEPGVAVAGAVIEIPAPTPWDAPPGP